MLTRDDLDAAYARVRPHVHRTPVLTSSTFDQRLGARLYFKCENFQKIGAFKFRGACNAVFSRSPEELARGVATHSSGNHAQAVALAARVRGVPAYVVMPRTASAVKVAAVRGYGAEVVFCEPNVDAREAECARVLAETSAILIHAFNDERVIAGQGTAVRELLEDVPDLDLVLAPLGGGGLLSGTALTVRALRPEAQVLGVEPTGADDGYRSLQAGKILPSVNPQTIADGLLTSLGELTFAILCQNVDAVVTVDDGEIIAAMREVWQRLKVVIEPSAAVPVAALFSGKVAAAGKKVGIILSGGNVDLDKLPWVGHA